MRRSKWGYLGNSKHFIFWLGNMKQLINFRHLPPTVKKFLKQYIFSRKKQKRLQKGQHYFVQYNKEFSTILGQFISTEDF